MSEGEVISLRNDIRALADKGDRQHSENQKNQERDRELFRTALATQQTTFAQAMDRQRETFQEAINKQFIEHYNLDKKVDKAMLLLENCVGDGSPGKGRMGVVEEGLEVMKKFRWQALAIVSLLMWAAEKYSSHALK